jgi:hypothetical protein
VYRKFNQLADWLANVAKELTATQDLTALVNKAYPQLLPFSEPPFPAKTIHVRVNNYEPPEGNLGYVGDTSAGNMGELGSC